MKIKFSRHARRQMKWRKIDEHEVREAISNPDRMEDTIKGRKNVFKMIEGRLLKPKLSDFINSAIVSFISHGKRPFIPNIVRYYAR